MPYGGSVNQMEPSDRHTTSFGELSRLPSKLSAITVMLPSYSVRVTRRVRCSQVSSRPCLSRVSPFELLAGCRNTLTCPVGSSHRMILLFGMSLHSRYRPSPNQTGPSAQRMPSAIRSIFARPSRYALNVGSSATTAGSG